MRDYYDEDEIWMDDYDDYDDYLKNRKTKVGDALSYGLLEELPQVLRDDTFHSGANLMACLTFLYLKGYISTDDLEEILKEIDYLQGKRYLGESRCIGMISRKILIALRKKFTFHNLDELIENLNKLDLPSWSFVVGEALPDKYTTGLVLSGNQLYYISDAGDKKLFCRKDVTNINENHYEDLDSMAKDVFLAYGYSRILGYDNVLKCFYLEVVNQEGVYHCYDDNTNSFMVFREEFVALKKGFPYIITEDMYFARVENKVVNKLRKLGRNERYCECEDYFLVRPLDRNKSFFLPYVVDFDGAVHEADEAVCRKIIWDVIQVVTWRDNDLLFDSLRSEGIEHRMIATPKVLCIDKILKEVTVRMLGGRSEDKRFLMLKDTLNILGTFIETSEDITKLLYVLYDIDLSMSEKIHVFPSEEFYWQLKELITTDRKRARMKNLLKNGNYEELKKLFRVKDKAEEESSKSNGMIGVFRIHEEELEVNATPISAGKVFGPHVIPDTLLGAEDGVVSYDSAQRHFYVMFYRALEVREKLRVMKAFHLSMDKITFFVQPQ